MKMTTFAPSCVVKTVSKLRSTIHKRAKGLRCCVRRSLRPQPPKRPRTLHSAPPAKVEAEVKKLAGVINQSPDGPNRTSIWFNYLLDAQGSIYSGL